MNDFVIGWLIDKNGWGGEGVEGGNGGGGGDLFLVGVQAESGSGVFVGGLTVVRWPWGRQVLLQKAGLYHPPNLLSQSTQTDQTGHDRTIIALI